MPWLLRASWVLVAVAGSPAVAAAVEDRSDPVRTVATAGAALVWLAGVVAMAVPATASLTATRLVVPLSMTVGLACVLFAADQVEGWLLLAAAVVATAVVASAELGRAFVQASAYGDEERFPLRPPLGIALAGVTTWLVWSITVVAGPLLVAAGATGPGAAVTLFALATSYVLARSWHPMSRRWLVLVPAGVVIHDPAVLVDTVMLPRSRIEGLRLAPADTEALDLTGPATGHAVEVVATDHVDIVTTPTRHRSDARAVHARACLVSPSRPGQFLAAAARRRLPVG